MSEKSLLLLANGYTSLINQWYYNYPEFLLHFGKLKQGRQVNAP